RLRFQKKGPAQSQACSLLRILYLFSIAHFSIMASERWFCHAMDRMNRNPMTKMAARNVRKTPESFMALSIFLQFFRPPVGHHVEPDHQAGGGQRPPQRVPDVARKDKLAPGVDDAAPVGRGRRQPQAQEAQ